MVGWRKAQKNKPVSQLVSHSTHNNNNASSRVEQGEEVLQLLDSRVDRLEEDEGRTWSTRGVQVEKRLTLTLLV